MGNIGALTEAIGAELRHAIRESQYSAGRNPDSYGAGFDAGWVEALRWVLKQADTTQSTRAA